LPRLVTLFCFIMLTTVVLHAFRHPDIDDWRGSENSPDDDKVANSPEGEHQFTLAVGQNTTVTGISQPIEVSAVGL
jgi:hypothetical protein